MTAETQVAKQVSEVSKIQVDERCGSDTVSYQDPTKHDGINNVGGNAGPADPDTSDGAVDNSCVFVSRSSNGLSDDRADQVVPLEESKVSLESIAASRNGVDSGEVNISNGDVLEHSLPDSNCVVQESEAVPVNSVDSLRKAEGVEAQVVMTDSGKQNDRIVGSAAAQPELVKDEIESSEPSFQPPENDEFLASTTDSVDPPNGIIAPKTDTMPQQLEVSLEPTQDKLSEAMVLEANTESGCSEEAKSLLPYVDDAVDENEETKVANLQTSDVTPCGQDSHLLVSESQATEQSKSAPPGTNQTGVENKEIEESNVEALDDSSQGQDSEFRVLEVNVESREESVIVSLDMMESRDDNKGIDEVQGSQNVVLEMDVDSRDRGETNDLSPDVKETVDDNKESEGEILGTSCESAEAPESQNVIAENAEYQLAEIESAKTTIEEQKDFQLSNEFLEGHESQNVVLGPSASRAMEVALENGNSEERNSQCSTNDLVDKHKSENVILKASGCQSGELDFRLNEESLEPCNSQQVVVNNPESVPKEAEVQILNSEQQFETESPQQVNEGGNPEVPEAVSLESGSCPPNDGGVNKVNREGKAVLCPNGNEIHVSDAALNQHVQVDLEAKSYSVNETDKTDTPLEADTASGSILDENKNELDVPQISECAQQTHDHNGSLDDGENPVEMNEASSSDHSLACAHSMKEEAESNGKPIESDENSPSVSRDITTLHHETNLENSTPSDAKFTDDAMPCSVGNIKVDAINSEKVVANGSIDGLNISSYHVNNETLGTESTLENVDSGNKDNGLQDEDVHLKTKDLSGDAESPDGHSVSADLKLDSQVEDSCTLGSREKLSNDVIATGIVVLDSSDINKEGTSKEVAEIVDVENVSDKFSDVDRNGEGNLIREESSDIEKSQITEVVTSMPECSSADAMAGQGLGVDVMMRPFNFLIKIPRFDDEKLRERIRHAQLQVEEKTQHRDAFRLEIQKKKANLQAYGVEFEAAVAEEREARSLVKKKRIEIESLQSLLNRVKNAISVDEIDTQIHKMEHMIQHETLPLKEEKQIIREMKRLNQLREQLSSNIGSEDKIEEARDQKDRIEDHLKVLKKELDSLKNKVLKAEAVATTARRKYDDENKKFKELQNQFKAADDIRQAAYSQLLSLRRELFEKNKQFREYKNDAAAATDYALNKNREALHRHCVNQVETIMELWNNSGEFRKEYVRCNLRSTLRRLGTLEGRSLGPDEKPPVVPSYVDERVDRVKFDPEKASSKLETAVGRKAEVTPVGGVVEGKIMTKVAEPVQQPVKVREPIKSTSANSLPSSSAKSMSNDDKEGHLQTKEKHLQTKEELELVRKAEELRKEEEAAKLKEQRRLEEMAKAKEALERKRRIAEKAQVRAELRAQKEAEHKEKEREKRLRKKERKKAVDAEALEGNGNGETAPSSESSMETAKDFEVKEIPPTTTTKRPQKPSHFVKQSKSKSIPPPLRNRSRRKMQQWMWVIFTSIVVVGLFYLGNMGLFPYIRRRKSGL